MKNNSIMQVTRQNFATYKNNGDRFLKNTNESILEKMVVYANQFYYNNEPLLSDNEYDILRSYIETQYPNNPVLKQIGAPIKKNKVSLPYFMGSMDKIKPNTKALPNWQQKYNGPYVLSVKLDGVSGLYTTMGDVAKLYTRGNGKVGQDVSHLIPFLKLPKEGGVVIRGEFIMKRSVYYENYDSSSANPRNLISGWINAKNISLEKFYDIDFVAYEVIEPVMMPSAQMDFLNRKNVICVENIIVHNITNETLSELLVKWRKGHDYESDGVIVCNNKIYPRKDSNPEYAFAFKMVLSEQVAEAKVLEVIWKPSKDGYLKPKIRIEPIELGGVNIEYATAFNAAYIKKNKIGFGATIKLIRSGDVIPHILETIIPAEQVVFPSLPYKWTPSNVDIILKNPQNNPVVLEKNITYFFSKLNVEGLNSGNVTRLIEAGFDSIGIIVSMCKDEFLDVTGFKEKMAQKLYKNIKTKMKEATIVDIMSASNVFGRGIGEKKIKIVLETYPNILTSDESYVEKFDKIMELDGFAEKSTEYFLDHVEDFLTFLDSIGQMKKLDKPMCRKQSANSDHPLYNKSIVMTGFRNKNLEEQIKNAGGEVGSGVSKDTFALIVKNKNENTSKIQKATQLGIPLYVQDEFANEFIN